MIALPLDQLATSRPRHEYRIFDVDSCDERACATHPLLLSFVAPFSFTAPWLVNPFFYSSNVCEKFSQFLNHIVSMLFNDFLIIPRILPLPAKVGFLPFHIPLFAGLSAAVALAGGAAGIAKAVNDSKTARLQLEETQRHNRVMENGGNGLYLKPHKTGLGIHRGLKKKLQNKTTRSCSYRS